MAKKGNTLTKHVEAAHHALGMVNFQSIHAEQSATRQIQRLKSAIGAGNSSLLITSSSVAGIDIYAPQPESVAYSGTTVKGGDLIHLVNETNSMTQADAVTTAYEVMEAYVKKLTAEFLYCQRGKIAIANKQKQRVRAQFGKKAEPENTKPFFRQLVGVLAWQNAQPLFDLLFKEVKGLEARVSGFRMGNLHVAHQAVEAIRHCKTHANGRYDIDRFTRLAPEVQNRLGGFIRKSFLHDALWYLPTNAQTRALIAREAEYAQVLYDSVSRELGMKIEWTPGRDPASV